MHLKNQHSKEMEEKEKEQTGAAPLALVQTLGGVVSAGFPPCFTRVAVRGGVVLRKLDGIGSSGGEDD